MALGAMQKYKCKVYVVACGMKYFKRHKFRSQACIEYGRPYLVPNDIAEIYTKDRRKACAKLLNQIEIRMREVTLTAPTYNELQAIYMARKLYIPFDM